MNVPQDLEAERVVITGLLIDSSARDIILAQLVPENFYLQRHALIFRAVRKLYLEGKPIDTIGVANVLKKEGRLDEIGGKSYLSECQEDLMAAMNSEHHIDTVIEYSQRRELIRLSGMAMLMRIETVKSH